MLFSLTDWVTIASLVSNIVHQVYMKFAADIYSTVPEISRTSSTSRRNSRWESARRDGKILTRRNRVREISHLSRGFIRVTFSSRSCLLSVAISIVYNDRSKARRNFIIRVWYIISIKTPSRLQEKFLIHRSSVYFDNEIFPLNSIVIL